MEPRSKCTCVYNEGEGVCRRQPATSGDNEPMCTGRAPAYAETSWSWAVSTVRCSRNDGGKELETNFAATAIP